MAAPLTVLVAPDSFKGTAPARDVAAALAEGWRSVRPGDDVRTLPQADGGEGTLEAIAAAVPGSERRDAGVVTGPDGAGVPAWWLRTPDGGAVVELAVSSGLPLLRSLDPLGATTRGLGEVIAAALDEGASSISIALGGSASTDGGAGALAALGARFLDALGDPLPDGGAALAELDRIDVDGLRPAPSGGVRLLTDVTSPLLGADGAAAVFGPQKGANPEQVRDLDAALARLAEVAGADPSLPGTGAAGGTAFGFAALWGARIEAGAAAIAELTGFAAAIRDADVVLTGEGRFDEQSAHGKVVGHAIELGADAGASVAVVAGRVDARPPGWSASLTELAGSAEGAMADPLRWLRVAGRLAAERFGGAGPAGTAPRPLR